MKREKLETYIGRQVKLLLFDGRAYEGCLQKTNTDAVKHNPNLYLKHNYYALLDKGGQEAPEDITSIAWGTRKKQWCTRCIMRPMPENFLRSNGLKS